MLGRVQMSMMLALETSLIDNFTNDVASAWSSVCTSVLDAILHNQTTQEH